LLLCGHMQRNVVVFQLHGNKVPPSYLLRCLCVLERAGSCLFIHDGEIPPCSGWVLRVDELNWQYATPNCSRRSVLDRHIVLSIGGFRTTDMALEDIVASSCVISNYVTETVSSVFDKDDIRRCMDSFDSVCDTSHPVFFVHTLFCTLPLVHVETLRARLCDP
jgi:hypothetical protein